VNDRLGYDQLLAGFGKFVLVLVHELLVVGTRTRAPCSCPYSNCLSLEQSPGSG
jgi:hypothetical protein